MEKYEAKGVCRKCGNRSRVGTAYHPFHAPDIAELAAFGRRCNLGDSEHMHRTCQNCGYEWAETPLDTKAQDA